MLVAEEAVDCSVLSGGDFDRLEQSRPAMEAWMLPTIAASSSAKLRDVNKRGLINFWGPKKPLIEITEGDAEAYKQHLITEGLAPATIRKRLYFASLIFRSAVKFRLISSNPFTDVRVKVPPPGRKHFITQEETERLIDACPNEDWRIIIALSRYGGLRCPSEVLSLRWSDIDWDPTHGVMHVRSPKTEHHPGKESRVVPIFGLLRPHLERAFEAAAEGSVYVVAESLRQSSLGPSGWRNTNLRKPFLAVIKRAGMKPWPRLFHNLRSSRETELMAGQEHAPNDVCTWIGNSLAIAQRHYLQVTQAAIAKAVAEPSQAAQNPAQHLLARSRRQLVLPLLRPLKSLHGTIPCKILQLTKAEGMGFEPTTPFGASDFESDRWPIRLPSESSHFLW
jgi:integrase